jgi:hypothetical protein
MQTTLIKDAIEWWENTIYDAAERVEWKVMLSHKYFGIDRNYTSLTNEEITEIYLQEPTQDTKEVVICDHCKRYHYKGIEECICGHKTFSYTHPYNAKHIEGKEEVSLSVVSITLDIAKELATKNDLLHSFVMNKNGFTDILNIGASWQKEQTKALEDSHKELIEIVNIFVETYGNAMSAKSIIPKATKAIETANKLNLK